MKDALEEFQAVVKTTKHCTARHVEQAIHLLLTSMTDSWHCYECSAPNSGYEEVFASTHGVSWISRYIPDFCSFFLIRSCAMSDYARRAIYTVMSKLTDFLFEKKHIDAEEKKELKQTLTKCRSVQGERIAGELQRLYDEGYWKLLARVAKEEDGANEEPVAKKPRTSLESGDEDGDDLDDCSLGSVEATVDDEMPLKVKEVTENSWIFAVPEEYDEVYRRVWNYGDGIPVMLPKEVAKLGRAGMEISCMMLQCRHGVWSPIGAHDERPVCANVYPPQT